MRRCSSITFCGRVCLWAIVAFTFSRPSDANAGELLDMAKSWIKSISIMNSSPEKCNEPPPGAASMAARVPAAKSSEVAKPPAAKTTTRVQSSDLYKNEDDLREYFKCYLGDKPQINVTLSKYLPMIQSAAKAYDIPPTLLACLLFRESMFDKNAKSPSGAVGLSQQLKKNLDYQTNVLASRTSAEADDIEATAARTPEQQVAARKNQISLTVAVGEIQQAQSRRKSLRLMRRWESYYQDLAKKGLHKGEVPRRLNTTNIKQDPALAIGAGAMYLRDILIVFRSTLDPSVQVDQAGVASDPDLLLAAAGAYNMGPGGESIAKDGKVKQTGAYQFIKPVVKQGYGAWVKALRESNEETSAHIVSIQNCMRPASGADSKDQGADPWAPPIGTAPRDCKNPVDGKYKTLSDKPADLPEEIKAALARKNAPASAAAASRANAAKPTTKKPAAPGPKKPAVKPAAKPAAKPQKKATTPKPNTGAKK